VSETLVEEKKYILKFDLPLAEIIIDFVDKIKSITHGYGSFEYEHNGFRKADIVKMVIHIMNDPVDALTFLVHNKKAFDFGKSICSKLKD
jgi:translation elongation factor EF-4